jgi:hypothetical protein
MNMEKEPVQASSKINTETILLKGPDGYIFDINPLHTTTEAVNTSQVESTSILEQPKLAVQDQYKHSQIGSPESIDGVGSIGIGATMVFAGLNRYITKKRIDKARNKHASIASSIQNRSDVATVLTGGVLDNPNRSVQPQNAHQKRQSMRAARKAHKARAAHGRIQLRNFATSSGKPNKPSDLGTTAYSISERSPNYRNPYAEKVSTAGSRMDERLYKKLAKADHRDKAKTAKIISSLSAQSLQVDSRVARKRKRLDKLENKIEALENRLIEQ